MNTMTADNDPIEHLYQRTLRVTELVLDAMEQHYAPPPPPLKMPSITDDPVELSDRRLLSDFLGLWMFCERTTCFRSSRCCGRSVHCYRFNLERVPPDALRGLKVWLETIKAGDDPRALRGERGRHIAALIDWRRRFGLSDLPAIEPRHVRGL